MKRFPDQGIFSDYEQRQRDLHAQDERRSQWFKDLGMTYVTGPAKRLSKVRYRTKLTRGKPGVTPRNHF